MKFDKVIFLDCDGVLNNRESCRNGIQLMNEKCSLLRQLVELTEAKIILSSSWRHGVDLDQFDLFLWKSGGPFKSVAGETPRRPGHIRGKEIEVFLQENEVSKYIIIDDDSDFFDEQKPFLIQTTFEYGLLEEHVVKGMNLLK